MCIFGKQYIWVEPCNPNLELFLIRKFAIPVVGENYENGTKLKLSCSKKMAEEIIIFLKDQPGIEKVEST
ncbi:hypothetical protein GYA37_02775 [candidate division WWE3 bacterium]|uniref:Uncharacterized protein n=1 Tax=candidate division WWE3 bacterium TaxID=2053526 RepID=A0A7X9HSS4_UNCKA|nr:hypothetical protein [candidate division WWE3 bacterium]